MAPLPVIPDIIRCAIGGTTPAGTRWNNVFHYENNTGSSDAVAIAAAQVITGHFYSIAGSGGANVGWLTYADNNLLVTRAQHTPLDGISASTVFVMNNPGSAVDQALPPDVAAVVSLRSINRGPRYRGRVYLPGFGEGANSIDGRIDNTVRAPVEAAAERWRAAMATAGVPLVIASYKYATSINVSSVSVDNIWDRQRRRR